MGLLILVCFMCLNQIHIDVSLAEKLNLNVPYFVLRLLRIRFCFTDLKQYQRLSESQLLSLRELRCRLKNIGLWCGKYVIDMA